METLSYMGESGWQAGVRDLLPTLGNVHCLHTCMLLIVMGTSGLVEFGGGSGGKNTSSPSLRVLAGIPFTHVKKKTTKTNKQTKPPEPSTLTLAPASPYRSVITHINFHLLFLFQDRVSV